LRLTDDPTLSLSRAVAILRHIGHSRDGIRVQKLHEVLRIPRASTYRVVNALVREELVLQDVESGLYRLGPGALNLGFFARESSPLAEMSQPVLRDVARSSGQLCELVGALGGWRLIALDVWPGAETPLLVRIRPGSVTTLSHTYTPGLVYLAFGGERRLRHYLQVAATADGRRMLGISQTPGNELFEDIDRWRRLQYAWLRQSGNAGVGRISAPIYDLGTDPQRVIAVLGIACAGRILTSARAAQFGMLLRAHGEKLERSLFESGKRRRTQSLKPRIFKGIT